MAASAPDWNWLQFDVAGVRALLEHAERCARHEPTPDQMLEARFRRADAPKPPRGELPPREHLALDAVPAGLHVIVGNGLYLTSNGGDGRPPERLYAPGCRPDTDHGWAAAVERVAGVERQVLFLPADAVREVLDEAGEQVWLGLCRDEEGFGVEQYGLAPTPEAHA